MYSLIDAIKQGEIAWNSVSITYNGPRPQNGLPIPPWMNDSYEIWFRDPLQVIEAQISNPEFNGMMDFSPKRVYFQGKRQYGDLMSGNWAWDQAKEMAKDESTHGAMFAPIILGSDKTTVSVATGHNEFYPLYASLGNVYNSVRRAHQNAVSLIAFLSIPKTSKEYADKTNYHKFRWQLFHSSLVHILSSLHPYMLTPRVTRCCDGHFRRVMYGLRPYIADYPEQALLACIVQNWCPKCTAPYNDLDGEVGGLRSHHHTNTLLSSGTITLQELWDNYGIVGDLQPFTMAFPRANIHDLLSPDLLHQIIKGAFKDHLVDWVEEYIWNSHRKGQAERILADIDRRITAVPSFPGLRHFHEGRGFKQWTGNDSKGLMKVYLPAIAGHVPPVMVKAVATLIELCYLSALEQIQNTLDCFHSYQEIFQEIGVRPDGFSLPRQHSLAHYIFAITQFGAPNGLCSSITESKHIKAVKRPYQRSNRNKPLGQMLISNQRIDKIAAARSYMKTRGLLDGPNSTNGTLANPPNPILPPTHLPCPLHALGPDDNLDTIAEIKLAKTHELDRLTCKIGQPELPLLVHCFIFGVLNPDSPTPAAEVPVDNLPLITEKIYVYNSARMVYYAPSDMSSLRGMHHERIWSARSWYGGRPRHDCVFIGNADSPDVPGFKGVLVACVFLFFSVRYDGINYPSALVHWFSAVDDTPDDETGMWVIKPDYFPHQRRFLKVIHLDSILYGAHLIGVAGPNFLPSNPKVDFLASLDSFKCFFVNKYADHHAHEIAF
ncbi:hypothetical protein EDB83DRAFT_2508493 [Lactarius deliciosus]|nr:hypothetical protein EDB83DRAFT_2508493 [Lactarius deliciosus]